MSQMDRNHKSSSSKLETGAALSRALEQSADPLKAERIQWLLKRLPGWKLTPDEKAITRSFQFPGVGSALAFSSMVAHLGAEQLHSARVVQQGGTVVCTLTSAWAGGLTLRDFELAKRIGLKG